MPMQEMTTETCWGYIWGREGLPRRDRSVVNLAMISVLNRPHELKIHVKAALRNGLSKKEISRFSCRSDVMLVSPQRSTASASRRRPSPNTRRKRNRGDMSAWPELPYAAWADTCATLQLWTQIVGKTRLSLTPWLNHSWHVTFRVSARGLITPVIPAG